MEDDDEDNDELRVYDNVLYLLTELERAFDRGIDMTQPEAERTHRRLARLTEMAAKISQRKAN